MTLKRETITSNRAMPEADPALLAQVQSCTDFATAAEMNVKAGAAQGLDPSAP